MTSNARPRRDFSRRYSAGDLSEAIERSTEYLLRGAQAKALEITSAAIERHPDSATIAARHGDALDLSGHIAQAREAYRRACVLDETEFQAWYGRACTEFAFEAYADAIACFRRALSLNPEDADTRQYLGRSLFYLGEIDAAIEELQFVAKTRNAEARREALQKIAVMIPGSPLHGNRKIRKARRKWAEMEEKLEPAQEYPVRTPVAIARKLRIGYVSAFFNSRNWMKPVWGTINRHDRSAFEIHLFLDGPPPDANNGYRRHADDSIHLIGELSNESGAEAIAEAGIDVLVDLNGYSAVERLGIFMRKPAPAIAGWFNTYAATGIRAFDYIVGDAAVIPLTEERHYGERVLGVTGSYLAFSVLYPVPAVAGPPCAGSGKLTFGCLAPYYKLTQGVISTWAEILKACPSARLLLRNALLDDGANRAALQERLAGFGIGRERVALEGTAEHYEFLATYGRVDIALDTFPYNGGTTTTEAIWQGVPVLTFGGDRWVSRTSWSILGAAGLGDWVMASREEYVRRAIALVDAPGTPGLLASLRQGMREQLLRSRACDSVGLCRELEAHYVEMARLSGVGRRTTRRRTPLSGPERS